MGAAVIRSANIACSAGRRPTDALSAEPLCFKKAKERAVDKLKQYLDLLPQCMLETIQIH